MHTNVKGTSIAAYHDKAATRFTLRHRIAMYILTRTRQGQRVWRGDIARNLQLKESTVSGRVNEIDKSGIFLDGKEYRLEYLKDRVKDPVTGVSCEAFALVLNSLPTQGKLFEHE